MSSKNASIVGAGLVGSLLSILLARRGYEVDVYERRPDFRTAGGAGGRSINLAMSDRGWKALKKAGIDQDILGDGIPMYRRVMHDTQGHYTFQPYGKDGQAIYSVSRGGLNQTLVEKAEADHNVNFHFEHSCTNYDLSSGEITFNNNHVKAPSLIFGSDGAFSAIRSSLQRRPRFNYSQFYLSHGYKELTIPAGPNGAFQMEKNALHIWPRGAFMLIALPNPDGSFTCTLFLAFEGKNSFSSLNTDTEIHEFFLKYFPDTLDLIPNLLEEFKENPTSSLVTIKCSPWSYNNVLLLGDASHAIVPFYGQGMNSGFEDCSILDELMEKYSENWPEIFQHFDEYRVKDADAISELAMRNFVEMRDLVGDPKFLLRKKVEKWLSEKYEGQYIPLYSQVTFSHIPYSQALESGKKQDKFFEEIMSRKDFEDNWMELDWSGILKL